MKHVFSKAKIQYLKHACSRSWVCINRGMSKLCFTIEMHAEELSSADATWLHCVLQSVVSGVAVHLLKSADSVIERNVLLNACFFFFCLFVCFLVFGCITRDQIQKVWYTCSATQPQYCEDKSSTVQAQGLWHTFVVTHDQLRQEIWSIPQVCSCGMSSIDVPVEHGYTTHSLHSLECWITSSIMAGIKCYWSSCFTHLLEQYL